MTAVRDVQIVPLTPLHAEVAAEIHRACFIDAWTSDAICGLVGVPGTEGFLAVAGDDPSGMILFRVAADEGEILTLAVLASARRSKIGSLLLQSALRVARGRGARSVYLEVAEDNKAAIALYDEAGFRTVGRRPDYYRTRCSSVAAKILRLDFAATDQART